MATLYDLAMQYLNQSLPKTFKYDRTNQPGSTPPVNVLPQTPNVSTAGISSGQGGGGGGNDFSVYNPDPNTTRDSSRYIERPYKSAVYNDAFSMMGDPMANKATGALNTDGLMSYAGDKGKGPVLSYLENSLLGKVTNMLPVNRTGILQNELLGSGFRLNNIGQIVAANPGSAYDPSGLNVMAGYNASKVTKETFDKRRAKAKEKMSPEGFAKFNIALTAAEDKFFGATDRTKTVFDAESLKKNPDYISQDVIDKKMKEAVEGDDDSDSDILDFTDPNIYNTNSIYTSVPTSTYDFVEQNFGSGDGTGPGGSYDTSGINSIDSTVYANEDNPNSVSTSGLTYNQGGGQDGSYDFVEQNFGGGNSSNYGTGSGNLGDYQIQPSKPEATFEDQSYSGGGGDSGDSGGGGKSIVCTAMYQTTGLKDWSKAMKIWYIYQKKYLTIQHQEGYHKLFKPFVKGMHRNKIIKAIGAHVAKHRTQDLKHIMFGSKSSWLGRIYRKILEPICYFVGKHG